MADLAQIGNMLQGMGAGFSGQLPQYMAAQEAQSRGDFVRDEARRQAAIRDFTTGFTMLSNGQVDQATQLFGHRLDMLKQLNAPDMSDTQGIYERLSSGDPAKIQEVQQGLQSFVQAGVMTGDIKMPEQSASPYKGFVTTQDGQRAAFNEQTGAYEVIPMPNGIRVEQSAGAQPPASLQEMAWLSNPGRTQTELDTYWKNKRAAQIVDIGGGGRSAVSPNGVATEIVAPEDATQRNADAASANAKGKATATANVDRTVQQRSNAMALDAYNTAMGELNRSLGATETGPMAGRIPAVTAKQQTAEGSIAAMAPILKQLFRSAGEGTFTDRDQALLVEMIPKRTDHPETIAAKTSNIDAIVKAKLGGQQGGNTAQQQRIGGRLMVDKNGNKAMVYPDGTVEEQ